MLAKNKNSAWSQSDFYRNCYHRILNWLIADVIIIAMLVIIMVLLVLNQAKPNDYASTFSGQILFLTPNAG